MATPAPSHRERGCSFSSTIRTFLQGVSSINASLTTQNSSLKQTFKRFESVLVTLEDSLRQTYALLRESDDAVYLETIFNLLFSGLDDTIRSTAAWSEDPSSSGQTRAAERLEARVVYHMKAAILISAHLERTSFRYTPNPRIDLQKMGAKWGEKQAQLEARLKNFFKCSSYALIYNSDYDPITPQSPLPHSCYPTLSSLSEPDSRLRQVHTEAGALVPGFPQSATLEKVMRVAIYSLARVPIKRNDRDHQLYDKADAVQQWLYLHGCGWVIHCMINQQVRKAGGRIGQVTELMLEEIIQAFSTYDTQIDCSAMKEAQGSCRFYIEDPLEASWKTERSTDLNIVQVGHEESICSAIAWSSETSQSAIRAPPSQFEENQYGYELDQAVLLPSEVELSFEEPLQTSYVTDEQPSSERHWIPSRVRVFKDQSKIHGKIRILIQQGQSFLKIHIDPLLDEIVPSYAFNGHSHALWFRTIGKDADLRFSTPNNRTSDLADFQSLFIQGNFESHFLPNKIMSLQFRMKNSKIDRQFLHSTAQIWTAPSEEEERNSDHSLRNAQTKSSESVMSCSQLTIVEAIDQEIEVSRLHFFCEPSIFTISISGRTCVKREDSNISVIESDLGKTTPLSVFETKGTKGRLIGIPLSHSALLRKYGATRKCANYYSVRIVWRTTGAREDFIQAFDTYRNRWLQMSSEKRAQRELLRDIVIESKSHFGVSQHSARLPCSKSG